MRIQFNTNRLYTPEGQRITAEMFPSGDVVFRDFSRMIDGHFVTNPRVMEIYRNLREIVMRHYDNMDYDHEMWNESRNLTWED